MATEVPGELSIKPIGGEARTVDEWLITFHLLMVVVDPYTYESSWILDTARRVLGGFRDASVRVAWVVTASEDEAKQFLGPLADEALTFVDPDRELVAALGLDQLPALVHLGQDRVVDGASGGWRPDEWREIAEHLAAEMHWSVPQIPATGDPLPYEGSPANA